MTKLLNEPSDIVQDYLAGLDASHRSLTVDHENRLVFRSEPKGAGKVALVSGGGSGHEPLHSGFVGSGMLDAACVGEIFSSPTPSQIATAIERCDTGNGVLLIVKNYMGDQLNFEIAAERAVSAGIDVRTITIDDDVATRSSRSVGRRGVGLTVLAEKILGSAAEAGAGLDDLHQLGELLRAGGRSMGIGMTSCSHPEAGRPTFEINDDEIEVGIGIHGEPGWRRQESGTANDIARLLVDSILDDLEPPSGCSFITLVNGMGGTPLVELYVVAGEISQLLGERGHSVDRFLVGQYITSLEMAGCSLTLLVSDDSLRDYWDAPVRTPALTKGVAA